MINGQMTKIMHKNNSSAGNVPCVERKTNVFWTPSGVTCNSTLIFYLYIKHIFNPESRNMSRFKVRTQMLNVTEARKVAPF
jgi:hypothetical protein